MRAARVRRGVDAHRACTACHAERALERGGGRARRVERRARRGDRSERQRAKVVAVHPRAIARAAAVLNFQPAVSLVRQRVGGGAHKERRHAPAAIDW